jgi:hypothetical protein
VPYANDYANRPFVPYPNAYDTQKKWNPTITQQTSDYAEKQQQLNKNLSKQVASRASMI